MKRFKEESINREVKEEGDEEAIDGELEEEGWRWEPAIKGYQNRVNL